VRHAMKRGRTALVFATAVLSLAIPSRLHAQSGVVEGTTVTQGTQRPLAGVQIGVEGQSGKGATSDASGRFRVTGLSGETVVLSVRAIGFRPVFDTVRVGATNVRIALSERAIELNQVVVTGTAGGAEKREPTSSIVCSTRSRSTASRVLQTTSARFSKRCRSG